MWNIRDLGFPTSTTGTLYGVFDTNGPIETYIMGYTDQASSVGGASGITSLYADFFTNNAYKKYYDLYHTSASNNFTGGLLGDSTKEMGPFGPLTSTYPRVAGVSSWYKDVIGLPSSNLP